MIEKLRQHTQELREMHDKFYKIFDELQNAQPSLEKCDEAFIAFANNITRQYLLEFELLDLTQRNEAELEIERLKAIHDRIVPAHWETRFLHRPKQNYAADLVDMEANAVAAIFYDKCNARITEKVEQRYAELRAQAENAGVLEEMAEYFEQGSENAAEVDSKPNAADETDEDMLPNAESASERDSEGAEPAEQEEEKPVEDNVPSAIREYRNKKKRYKGAKHDRD